MRSLTSISSRTDLGVAPEEKKRKREKKGKEKENGLRIRETKIKASKERGIKRGVVIRLKEKEDERKKATFMTTQELNSMNKASMKSGSPPHPGGSHGSFPTRKSGHYPTSAGSH